MKSIDDQIVKQKEQVEEFRLRYVEKNIRFKGLEKIIDRRIELENIKANKNEQKRLDDLVTNSYNKEDVV